MKRLIVIAFLVLTSCSTWRHAPRQSYRSREHRAKPRKVIQCNELQLAGIALTMVLTSYSSPGLALIDLADQMKSCEATNE